MKIEAIDRPTAKILHHAINEALKKVAQDFGLEYTGKNGTFNDGEFRTGVVFRTPLAPTEIPACFAKNPVGMSNIVKDGLAKRGWQVRFGKDICMVIEARKTRYVLQFPNGKQYLVPFGACSPAQ